MLKAIERQVDDALAVHQPAQSSGLGFDQRRRGCDRNRIRDTTHLQGHIDCGLVVNGQRDAAA
jgi:hypothetical protein